MGFAEQLAQTKTNTGGNPGRYREILAALGPDDATALEAALADPTVAPSRIRRVLLDLGQKISLSAVCRWANEARGQ